MNLLDNTSEDEQDENQLKTKPNLQKSFYSILKLNILENNSLKFKEFSEKDIKKATRNRSLKYHPDKLKNGIHDFDKSARMFHLIQLASATLSDPILKDKYDDLLRAEVMRELRFKV